MPTLQVGAAAVNVATSIACSSLRIKQISSNPASFFVTDNLLTVGRQQIPAGGAYVFSQAQGWLAGVVLGTVQMADPNATIQSFSVEESGPGGGALDNSRQIVASSQAVGTRASDVLLEAVAGPNGITLTLPNLSMVGQSAKIRVMMIDAGPGSVSIAPYGTNTINGGSSAYSLGNQWQYVQLERDINDANNWLVTAAN